jgi:hypothetical protein
LARTVPLGNPLAVLMRELLDQLVVLQQDRATRTRRDGILMSATGAPAVVVSVGLFDIVATRLLVCAAGNVQARQGPP